MASKKAGITAYLFYSIIFIVFIGFQLGCTALGSGERIIRGNEAERLRWILLSDKISEESKINYLESLYKQQYSLSSFLLENREKGFYKEVPLSLACFAGDKKVVQFLINTGVNLDEHDSFRMTSFYYAAEIGDDAIINSLLGYKKVKKTPFYHLKTWGLFYYIRAGHSKKEVLNKLIGNGVDYRIFCPEKKRDIKRCSTPLSLACFYGNKSAFTILLEMGASTSKVCKEVGHKRVTLLDAEDVAKKGRASFFRRLGQNEAICTQKVYEYDEIIKELEAIKLRKIPMVEQLRKLRVMVPVRQDSC